MLSLNLSRNNIHRVFILLLVMTVMNSSRVFCATALRAEGAGERTQWRDAAVKTFDLLKQAYERGDSEGFLDLVDGDFRSSDGKRKHDIENSLRVDFDELRGTQLRFVSVIKTTVYPKKDSVEIVLVADWNRTTDVEISQRRRRWTFEGRTEFVFKPVAAGETALKLLATRGDSIFALTDTQGLLQIEPARPGRRSLLDGETVTAKVAVGETAFSQGRPLRNKMITMTVSVTNTPSIDFSSGAVVDALPASPSGQGDVYFERSSNLIIANGSARLKLVPGVSDSDFNEYNKDTEPANTSAPTVQNSVYLVKTKHGRYAKFIVMSYSPASVTIKYAFQPDRSGTLASVG